MAFFLFAAFMLTAKASALEAPAHWYVNGERLLSEEEEGPDREFEAQVVGGSLEFRHTNTGNMVVSCENLDGEMQLNSTHSSEVNFNMEDFTCKTDWLQKTCSPHLTSFSGLNLEPGIQGGQFATAVDKQVAYFFFGYPGGCGEAWPFSWGNPEDEIVSGWSNTQHAFTYDGVPVGDFSIYGSIVIEGSEGETITMGS
jgi:hypothetical protein